MLKFKLFLGIIPTIQIISGFLKKNQANKQNNRIDTFQNGPFLILYQLNLHALLYEVAI